MSAEMRAERDTTRQQVLAAARDCFRSDGVRKVTVDSVARTAGVSRQTVYRYYSGRTELVQAVAAARITELADAILVAEWDDHDPGTVFVERCSAIVTDIRDDAELRGLVDDGPLTLHEILWQPEVWLRGLTDWTDWLRRSRAAGMISAELTDEDIYDWLQTVLTSIILAPRADEGRVRRQLDLLLRSLRPVGRGDRAGRD